MKNKKIIIYFIAIAIVFYIGLSFIFSSFNPKDMIVSVKGFSVVLWAIVCGIIIVENK